MATVKPKGARISLLKIATVILLLIFSAASAWLFQPKYHGNDEALASLVSIFSVLAGFLAAIIAVVANDRALKGRTWRHDTYYLQRVKVELRKHQFLFYLYLITLVLAFFCQLKFEMPWGAQVWFERLLMFFATLSMSMSFALPARLTKRQIEDLEKVIKDREQKESGNKRGL